MGGGYLGLCFILLMGSSGCALKPNQQMIPREVLFGNPEKLSPKLSPDGKRIAYLAPDQEDVLNVWVREVNKEEGHLVTHDQKRGIRSFFWEYTGHSILYIQDRDGDENWHLYQTNLKTGQTRDLTPFSGVRAGVIAYEPELPQELLVTLNIRNSSFFDVYKVNLETGSLEMVVENTVNARGWLADHQLHVRAFQAYAANGDCVIQIRQDLHSPWEELIRGSSEDTVTLLEFSKDNKSIYLVSNLDTDTAQLIEVNLLDQSRKILAQDPLFDLSSVLINPKSHEIEAVGVERDRLGWIVLDSEIEKDFAQLERKNKTMRIVSRDDLDQRWIVLYSSDLNPAQYYIYTRGEKEPQFLFDARPKLNAYSLSEMMGISLKARDGMELYGYLTLPTGKEAKGLPAVLMVHGGPWSRDSWGYSSYVQLLASRGYAVLQVNFRGSTGYGKKYLNAGNREWAGKMHTDLLDSKQWLIDQGYVNPDKVAIFGGSYGGYATLVGLAFTPKEFACGVDVVGPSNLVTLLQTLPPYWAAAKTQFDIRVGNLERDREFLESKSPLFKANQIERPLLIVQGANDPRVKQSESDQIVSVMRKNGQEVDYLLFLDEGHGLARPENMLKFGAILEEFLAKHLY